MSNAMHDDAVQNQECCFKYPPLLTRLLSEPLFHYMSRCINQYNSPNLEQIEYDIIDALIFSILQEENSSEADHDGSECASDTETGC